MEYLYKEVNLILLFTFSIYILVIIQPFKLAKSSQVYFTTRLKVRRQETAIRPCGHPGQLHLSATPLKCFPSYHYLRHWVKIVHLQCDQKRIAPNAI